MTFPILAKVARDQPSTLLPAEDEFLLSADIYVPGRRGGGMGGARQDYAKRPEVKQDLTMDHQCDSTVCS